MGVPKRIIIVPYRDRESHKKLFSERMKDYFKEESDIEIYFAHQMDSNPFNRGAMKNIGFLAMKHKYPHHYKEITFIFHDVDTWPRTNGLIPYETIPGRVCHFYGHKFALGGIFAIKGKDFEKIKGFPNFWGWGLEDNVIQHRCLKNNIKIDRSCFYIISDYRIVRMFDGFDRIANIREPSIYKYEEPDNIEHIKSLKWNIKNDMINIYNFKTSRTADISEIFHYDIRGGSKMKIPKGMTRKNWSMNKIMFAK